MLLHSGGRSPLEGLTRNERPGVFKSIRGGLSPHAAWFFRFERQMLNALVQRAPRLGDILGGLPVDVRTATFAGIALQRS